MANKEKISERQNRIMTFIHKYMGESGRPPTIREIGEAAQISSTSVVNYNLNKLTEKGYLERDAEVSRGLKLTRKALERFGEISEALSNLVRIPLKGVIVASEPVDLVSDTFESFDEEDAIEISQSLLDTKRTDDLFALRVSGNSMIDAMVNDGDIVIMRHQVTARDGEMVAVWLTPSDTTTLKRFYHEGNRIRLQPANPTMAPIYVKPSEVRVQGKVMMVLRNTA